MTNKIFQKAHTETFLNDLRRANTEAAKKERFVQYLTTVFAGDTGAQALIAAMSLGAEHTIANIPRGAVARRGRADTQTDTIIIEWEKDLKKTGAHAVEQLTDYLNGNWRSGQEYRYVLLATDGIRWRVYAPDWSHQTIGAFELGSGFKLKEIRAFDLTPQTFDIFPFFLDETLFVSRAKLATLANIQADFGDTSAAFINSMRSLKECAKDVTTQSELKVAFEQWRKFLSIAYGRFDDSPEMFLVHTYLSAFAKFIAYAVLTKRQISDDETRLAVLNGSAFENLNVERFVEDDFFHWISADTYFTRLKPMFRALNREIAKYDFGDVKEDILKGVYQELIDLDTRHALGEYYTPDWLCERIVDELPLTASACVLDPACGSGSFLRAMIARMRRDFDEITANEMAAQVVGMDIHPLSVQISKTTVLLALGDTVRHARTPVTLHIYLANSLLLPRGTADLLGSAFKISIDNITYTLDISGLDSPEDFDRLVTFCDEMVSRYDQLLSRQRFLDLADKLLPAGRGATLGDELYRIYEGLKKVREEGRDSIWTFILQNTYKPVFLQNRFDFVVGNPPWLTYAAVTNADYQRMLLILADDYGVTPLHRANMPHLEIAAIFLAHCANYFLRPTGDLAFVLPRSFMTADQHDNTRSGAVEGLQLHQLWDLKDVEPLFRVPSCALFARWENDELRRRIPSAGISGYVVSGRLSQSHLHWADARRLLKMEKADWHYSKLQSGSGRTRSAITQTALSALDGQNAYADLFTQGATIVPRNFYFIDLERDAPAGDLAGRVISASSSKAALREAKPPWKSHKLTGRVEGDFIYHTALSRNIVPFALVNPPLVLLPMIVKEAEDGKPRFKLLDHEALLKRGARYTSKWFFEAHQLWEENRTEKAEQSGLTLLKRLDYQRGMSEQLPAAKYLVIYTSSAQDASATTVDRTTFDAPFVVDHKAYWCQPKSLNEAHYLCAFLNSGYANLQIKEFQSRGLFGARDIHKTIVKLPFPRFKAKDEDHARLAALGQKCAKLASRIVDGDPELDLEPRALGRLRSYIRQQLEIEISEIDGLVEKLSTGKSEAAIRASGRGKHKRSRSGRLFD
ncbi:MAG: N-6 DNA methylase [Gammaproteobacteria bacterium]